MVRRRPARDAALHPTACKWLNMVDLFFPIITREARGTSTLRPGPHGKIGQSARPSRREFQRAGLKLATA